MRLCPLIILLICSLQVLVSCDDQDSTAQPTSTDPLTDTEIQNDYLDAPVDAFNTDQALPSSVVVTVTLDGEASPDTLIVQGGVTQVHWITDDEGNAVVEPDYDVEGEIFLMASHPEARIRGTYIEPQTAENGPLLIELERYDTSDNEEYIFQHPGTPDFRPNTAQCAHCHHTINNAWYESPHRTSASNPAVLEIYTGAVALDSESSCEDFGGSWMSGPTPGGGSDSDQCYLPHSALSTMNENCEAPPCDDSITEFGGCADCHAPGIEGVLGGRDLLDAEGIAYDYGVHCDVCHRIDAIDLSQPPGVNGRLILTRPSETAPVSLGGGGFLPLTFGPSHDSPNVRMGSVQRDHFHQAEICAGCHQQEQPVLVQGAEIDLDRWPDGTLPIHSTYEEWINGPLNPAAPCQSCHMPSNPVPWNHADLQLATNAQIGIQGGWLRPPGTLRDHAWYGPRQPASQMLQLAAGLHIDKSLDGDLLNVQVTVKNAGPGHAIPTGEPLRAIFLTVSATCDDTSLIAVGGDAIPGFGGWHDLQDDTGDWSRWPSATAGQRVRVTEFTGEYHDYTGTGPFGDGRFSPEEKGLAVEVVAGYSTIISLDEESVSFDTPLPAGDMAYLVDEQGTDNGDLSAPLAGSPGFAFARVLADIDGQLMVPHYAAVDVISDNRILPYSQWTSSHSFDALCDDPLVTARLLYRPYPFWVSEERSWSTEDTLMVESTR